MPELSLVLNSADRPGPQLRKRIPFTGTGHQTIQTRVKRVLNQLTTLRHQNVEEVHEVHFDPPKDCYLLCESLEGDSLFDFLARERLIPLERVRTITRQAASALTAAHNLGIMHGNLSPHAIIVRQPDADTSLLVKVRDFGLGKPLAADLFGALGYLAPEQVDPRDPRPDPTPLSDQFALAVIAFEMLAGKRAFMGDTLADTCLRLFQDPVHFQIQGVGKKESARVIAVLHKAMSRLPSERFTSLNEFVTALEFRPSSNKSRGGSLVESSRYSVAPKDPLQAGASNSQALVVASRALPAHYEPPPQAQEAPTMTLIRYTRGPASQAATMPMVDRLELQVNVRTTIANQIDNSVAVYPQQRSAPQARSANPWVGRVLRLGLLFAIMGGALLLYIRLKSQSNAIPSVPSATPPSRIVSGRPSGSEKPIPATPEKISPDPPLVMDGTTAGATMKPLKLLKKPVHLPRFRLECAGTSKFEGSLSERLTECKADLNDQIRGRLLMLPYAVSPEGEPVPITGGGLASGPGALLRCLQAVVVSMKKSEYGKLPLRGGVLRCTLK